MESSTAQFLLRQSACVQLPIQVWGPSNQIKSTQKSTGFLNMPHLISCLLQTTHYTSNAAFPVMFFIIGGLRILLLCIFFRLPPTRNVVYFMHLPEPLSQENQYPF